MTLKDEYKDKVVKVNSTAGLITFDTTTTPETDYPLLSKLGFDFCFEPDAVTYKAPIYYKGVLGMEEAGKMGLLVDNDQSTKGNKKRNGKKAKAESKTA